MSWVGRSVPRSEDPRLLQGLGSYFADVAVGALRVRFVRSPIACGILNGISKPAERLVFTAADLADVRPIRPLLHRPDYVAVEQPILATGRLLFVGQPVAAVLAGSQEAAEDLADQVAIDCEPGIAVVDVDQALADDGQLVHAGTAGNVLVEGRIETPGYAAARAAAPHTVEIDIVSRRQNASPMEPRGGVAQFDRASGRVRLTCSVQMPHMLRTGIADCLGMPEADLQVVAPDVGGGFGQKMALVPEYVFLVWAARRSAPFGRLGRGPQRESHRRLPQPRPAPPHHRVVRRGGSPARARRRHPLQRRCLLGLSGHLRCRAADGNGGTPRSL